MQELLYQEDIEWGGTWHSVLDYMHFEIPKSKVVNYLENENE
ncbi:MAG: M15 family metallopeptidase [Bacteroidota bacterium]